MKALVITEKPSVAMSISKILGATNKKDGYYEGKDYIVSWCIGHLIQMANPSAYDEKYAKWKLEDLPIIPKEYKYEVSKATKKQFTILKKLMNDKDTDIVINACDEGREHGNAADSLDIANSNEGIQSEINIADEKEVEQTSFSFTQNLGQMVFPMLLSQNQIDTVLINGGNEHNLRLNVIAEFSKNKTEEELADFLKHIFKGGNGFYLGEQKICAWYGKEGIYLSNGRASREDYIQLLSWEDTANRIGQLLDEGKYATNVELLEAFSNERAELAENLWYLKGDFRDDVINKYLPVLNEKQRLGYPEKTQYLAKMLEDGDFRANLRVEYTEFLNSYKEPPNILRFRYHKLNDIHITGMMGYIRTYNKIAATGTLNIICWF